jgi:hypothetical protein
MGSVPWKHSLELRLFRAQQDARPSDLTITAAHGGQPTTGAYDTFGSRGQSTFLVINTAPEGTSPRDPIFFDYDEWVPLDRKTTINGVPAPDWQP